jgi:tetratricopeptide (TPR) repeat protein
MAQKNNNKTFHIFESVLFVFLMCVIALRLSFMENPHIESFNLQGIFYDNFLSISISSLLIISAVIWFVVRLWSGNFRYRLSGFEYGILIFVIACAISTIAASNRRAAVTDSITILSAMLTAVVLSNLLETIERKKVLLFVLIAMGIANVYQCSEQFFSSNKLMIEEYKAEPTTQLEKLGIEPGSFEHMLYEHRLYSKDVRGFFTTGNSAACLLVLAIFCTLAVFKFKPDSSGIKNNLKRLWLPTVLLLVLFAGLLEAHSKGAIVSLAAAGLLLFLSVRFGQILRRHRGLIMLTAIILITLCVISIINYGVTHNTLPGGNSMLVRWQYWSAAAKIIARHLMTGIGGGNFGSYYTHYKIPQALETVRDPHCFVLSILSQYGIIGLAGFCIAIFSPIITCCIQNKGSIIRPAKNNPPSPRLRRTSLVTIAKACGISIVLVLLFVRPIAVRAEIGSSVDVILYVIAIMYAAPAFFAGTTLWLCTRTESSRWLAPEQSKTRQIFHAAILCGLAAVLIHNLIDFALFEPGIMTALWACTAIVCSDYRVKNLTDSSLKPNKIKKIILTASALITATALIWFCIIPGAKTAVKTEKARLLFTKGELEEATALLIDACADDTLNPTPAAFAGKMLLYKFEMNPGNRPDVLLQAEKSLLAAIRRDKADFKNYENLAKVYETLAQITGEKRQFWFEKTFLALQQALVRYPWSAGLHVELAETCEQLGKTDLAIEHYRKAIKIEDVYTEQFKIMYPEKEVFSRMGKIKYREAKEKLEELTRKMENRN